MKRYLLDSNIVSEPVRPRPSASVVEWLAARADADLFIATMSIAEIRRGLLTAPVGAKRARLQQWFEGSHGPLRFFRDRLLPFDVRAAEQWATLMAEGQATGRSRSPIDMIIAATAAANDCVLVTANTRHFQGIVPVLNPFEPDPQPG